MEKYGFVYIWYDQKRKQYYIGSHWGTETDGYLCSSNWMRDAHRRRPQDFKRRIIQKIHTNKRDTRLAEQRWLDLIEKFELGVKYYNRTKKVGGLDSHTKGISEEARKKMRAAKLGKSNPHKGKSLEELHGPEKAAEIRIKLRESHLGQESWNKGKPCTWHWTKNQTVFSENPQAQYMRQYRAKKKSENG